jgi:hypothetical protein
MYPTNEMDTAVETRSGKRDSGGMAGMGKADGTQPTSAMPALVAYPTVAPLPSVTAPASPVAAMTMANTTMATTTSSSAGGTFFRDLSLGAYTISATDRMEVTMVHGWMWGTARPMPTR